MRLSNKNAVIAGDDARIAGEKARAAGFKAAAARELKRKGYVARPEGAGWTSTITKSTRPGVAYQVTTFSPDGQPRGHGDALSLDDALERLWVNCRAEATRTERGKPAPDRRPKGERSRAKVLRLGRLI